MGCHASLQGIFPTQGSNPRCLHCRQILHHLTQQGSPLDVGLDMVRNSTCLLQRLVSTSQSAVGLEALGEGHGLLSSTLKLSSSQGRGTKTRTSKPRWWFPGPPAWDLNDVILWLFSSASFIPSASSEQLRWLHHDHREAASSAASLDPELLSQQNQGCAPYGKPRYKGPTPRS